ncbi:uncharacterized protein LOC116173444 [Photinus pyralis]|uniref:uncharacterized protein LOC116173444 n=1 Tax=Photinus pyralis TaxID=7054 RepID=UPI0012674034|nr:uncharacterized protein LOC116173444 [Photinus pyralis]
MAQWSDESSLLLIEIYKNYEVLWNPRNENYYNKNLKVDAWKEIAAAVEQPEEACKAKIISLLASYRREKAREKKSKGTGSGVDNVYNSRWFAYEALRFLEDRDKPRKSMDTESQQEERGSGKEDELQTESEIEVEKTPTSAPKRRIKTSREEHSSLMVDAVAVLKTAASKLTSSCPENDEVKAFLSFVMAKMNSYSFETRKGVEHSILDTIMKADRGFYEFPAHMRQYGQQRSHIIQLHQQVPTKAYSRLLTRSINHPPTQS